jgi:hypothetical protein
LAGLYFGFALLCAVGAWATGSREVQLLVNVIEPDPKMQPSFTSDEGRVFDIRSLEDKEIRERLAGYFCSPIRADLEAPLWRLVDLLKVEFPGWPDDPPWERQ